ncbi:MAG: HD domain-containing phosphohydrolase [Candidatus Desantisbacteria bacterium]
MENSVVEVYAKGLQKFLENGSGPEKIETKQFAELSVEDLSLTHLSALPLVLETGKIKNPSELIKKSRVFLEVLIRNQEIKEEASLIGRFSKLCGFLTSTMANQELLDLIMQQALSEVKGETGSLMLLDEKKEFLSIKSAVGLSDEIIKITRIKMGEGIAGNVARTGEPILFNEASKRKEIKSAICLPLSVKEEIVGVLAVNRVKNTVPFNNKDLFILSFLSKLAAATIINGNLQNEIKKGYLGTVKTLIAAVEAKDHYTRGHSEAVARYTTAIAKEFGFGEEEAERLYIAGLLHDIGKIGIKEDILLKPGKLTREEYEVIKEHPMIGAKILGPAGFHPDVMRAVSFHHERPDGWGYPQGIKENGIYLGAAIINVADTFDAMTSERPYRPALSIQEAVEELKKHAGTQFNKGVVEKFLIILARKGVVKE